MPSLGSQAHHRARGDRNPHVGFDDPLENRGWAIWYSVRMGKARVSGTPQNGPEDRGLQDVPGFVVEVNLTTRMSEAWSEFKHLDRPSREAFASEIRTYLRASGNAVCLRTPGIGPGDHGQPLWWVREDWNDVKAVGIFRQTDLTRRERQLSAVEAGEDRPPAPVETRRADATASAAPAAAPASSPAKPGQTLAEMYEARRAEHAKERDERYALIRAVLKAADYPLYSTEVRDAVKLPHSMTEKLLREGATAGVFRRLETTEERAGATGGRAHYLYWYEEPIPPRPADAYRTTRSVLDRLQNGDTILADRLSSGPLADVQALVETGLAIEWTGKDGRVRYRIAPDAGPDIIEPRTPQPEETMPVQTEDRPQVAASLDSVMMALSDLIETQVQAATKQLQQRLSDAESAVAAEREARIAVERKLAEVQRKAREAFGL